jgi:hypothetical protein
MSKDGAPTAQSFLELIYGAKRRLPSIFGVPCSSFDIPAEGGSFSGRSPEKSVATSCCKIEILKKMKEELQIKNVGWRLENK